MLTFAVDWLLFVVLNLLFGSNAALWALLCPNSHKGLVDFSANWITLFLGQIVLIQTGLGAVGLLNSWNTLIVAAVICFATVLLAWRRSSVLHVPVRWQEDIQSSRVFLQRNRGGWLIILLVTWLVLGLAIAALATPSTFWDTLSYHLATPVNWTQAQRLEVGYIPSTEMANSYFPGNGELVYLWALAPFRNDLLVRTVCLGMWLGLGIALFRLCRKLGGSAEASLASTGLLLFTPIVLSQATELALDLASAALFLLALGHLFEAWQETRWDTIAMFSVAAGLFLGVKYSAPAYSALLLCAFAVFLWHKRHALGGRVLIGYLLTYALGSALLGGYWYFRNFALAGNPIYPLQVHLLGHVIFPGGYNSSHYFNRLSASLGQISLTDLAGAALTGLGLFPIFMFALSIILLVRSLLKARGPHNRQNTDPSRRSQLAVLGAMIGLSLILYLNTPYSTMQLSPDEPIKVYNLAVGMRMGMISFSLCGTLVALAFTLAPRLLGVVWLTLGPFWAHTLLSSLEKPILWDPVLTSRHALAAAAILMVLVLVYYGWQGRRSSSAPSRDTSRVRTPLIAAVILLLLGVALYGTMQFREHFRYALYEKVYGDIGAGWKWLSENVANTKVAVTGSPLSYPLTGHDLGNRVRYVNVAGGLDDRYHDYDKGSYRANADYQVWLRNLAQWQAQYLLTTDTLEDEWAAEHPEVFEPVFSNSDVRVYQLRQDMLQRHLETSTGLRTPSQ